MRNLIVIATVCWYVAGVSQVSFLEMTGLNSGTERHSGLPVAVIDMNGDLLDDVVFLNQGTELIVAYQQWHGDFFTETFVHSMQPHPQWSMVVGDIDHNGWNDIIVAGSYDNIKVFYQTDGNFTLQEIRKPLLFSQAMNLVDIDGDGWLDLFVCNDINYNLVMWNDEGQFQNDTTGLFKNLPAEMAKGNYGSEWIDIENDGDLDLHISKCFAGADDPTDPRRLNLLYVNNGDGTFSEEAGIRGLANGSQSWTGHWFDSDNDGDMDLLVTNHDRSAQLFLNDGHGYFLDLTEDSGLNIGGPVIQSLSEDFNLDGREDIVVGGFPEFFYLNSGHNEFHQVKAPFGTYDITTMAIGDLDNDRKPDLYTAHLNLINIPTSRKDKVYLNRNKGKVLQIHLQSNESASPGVGAVITAFSQEKKYTRAIRSGESYGVQNSHIVNLGLGQLERVDLLKVVWPDGTNQTLYDVETDQYVVFHKNGWVVEQKSLQLPSTVTLCPGDTVALVASIRADTFMWNGKPGSQVLRVFEEGFHQLQLTMSDGARITVPGVVVKTYDFDERSILVLKGDTVNCTGDTVILEQETGRQTFWSNGVFSDQLVITNSGTYTGEVETTCADEILESVDIVFLNPSEVEVIDNEGARPGEDAIIRTVDSTSWYRRLMDEDPVAVSQEIIIQNVQSDTFVYGAGIERHTFPVFRLGKSDVNAKSPYHDDQLNGTMLFDVQQPSVLRSVRVKTDFPGVRRIILLNDVNGFVDSATVYCDTGWTLANLNFELLPEGGLHRLTTDQEVNFYVHGTRSPQFMSCDQNIDYPYIVDGVVRLLIAQYGFGTYNYFYDWRVQPMARICEGSRTKIDVRLNPITSVENDTDETTRIWPNPSDGEVYVHTDWSVRMISCTDLHGRELDVKIVRLSDSQLRLEFQEDYKGLVVLNLDGRVAKVLKKE